MTHPNHPKGTTYPDLPQGTTHPNLPQGKGLVTQFLNISPLSFSPVGEMQVTLVCG